jgi:hypothetical protein
MRSSLLGSARCGNKSVVDGSVVDGDFESRNREWNGLLCQIISGLLCMYQQQRIEKRVWFFRHACALLVTTRVTTVTTLCMLVSSAFIVNKLVFFFALLC